MGIQAGIRSPGQVIDLCLQDAQIIGVSARQIIVADIEKRLARCLEICTEKDRTSQAIIMADGEKLNWGTVHWDH